MAQEVQDKVVLICIDGWGVSDQDLGNAIMHAKTPVMDSLAQKYPYMTIAAHGLSVGLPDGLMGNSEVGHLNVGAGRVVYQDIVRIDKTVQEKKLGTLKALKDAFDRAKSGNGRVHFLGLVSDGGVHSHINHLFALLECAKEAQVPKTFVQFFADGRDTRPTSGVEYFTQLDAFIKNLGYGSIATIVGRYYAMDRDNRWERIKVAYESLVDGIGESSTNGIETIKARYANNETDEFLKPIILDKEGSIQDGDTLVFFDYRSDRMREIFSTFAYDEKKFETSTVRKNLHVVQFTQYKAEYNFPVIFPPQTMDNVLAEWLSKHKLEQFHCAETEKYAHVTFFFNGGTEKEFEGETRRLVPSPKVATYDLQPEMSAIPVAEAMVAEINTKKYPFLMCNFANPDMVGHTGVYDAAVKAVETTDKAIGMIYDACVANGYILFITADHGNAEQMISEAGGPHTAHTCNRVPLVMTSSKHKLVPQEELFALCDVAPTILKVMGLPIPEEMSGKSLIQE